MSEARPPLTRVLSSRLSNKVSCETLILSNVHSKLPCDLPSVSFSDDDDKPWEIEADRGTGREQHIVEHVSECTIPPSRCGNFENPSHCQGNLESPPHHQYGQLQNPGHGSLKFPHDEKPSPPIVGRSRRALAHMLSKVLHLKHSMSDAGNPAGRNRKSLRKFLSAPSGGLVAHSAPIILPIGSHSGPLNNVNGKAPVLLKASSIIPSNAVSGKMSALVIKDPSSPKVTCLGRVRIEQQSRKNAAKATPVVAEDGNRNGRLHTCWAPKPKRREKKADVEAFASACTPQRRREKLDATGHMQDRHRRTGSGSNSKSIDREMARPATKIHHKGGEHRPAEKRLSLKGKVTLPSKYITKEENIGLSQVKVVNSEEANICHQYEETWRTQKVPASAASISLEADACLNLSRFGSVNSKKMLETNAPSSSVIVDSRSKRFESNAGQESGGGQAPPLNALILMRNGRIKDGGRLKWDGDSTHIDQAPPQNALQIMKKSKPKGYYLSPSGVSGALETINIVSKQSQPGCDKKVPPQNALQIMKKSKPKGNYSPPSGVSGAPETVNIVSKQLQPGCDKNPSPCLETKMKTKLLDPSSGRLEPLCTASGSFRLEDHLSSQRKKLAIHRQVSFQNAEVPSLWQRRGTRKPNVLGIGRPNPSESKQPITM